MKNVKNSKYVKMYRDEDGINISARPINAKSKYTIEFESADALEFIFDSYPYRQFEGFFANFNDRYDKQTGKAYVDITFKKISNAQKELLGRDVIPHFTLILMHDDTELAEKIYKELNSQALEMEANKFCLFNK